MDEQIKICPECGAEYYAHIKSCKGCEVDLIFPHEKAAYKKNLPKAEGELVCIEEGPYDRVSEISRELKKEGIEAQVLNAGAGKSCSSSSFGLFVPMSIARETVRTIEEIYNRLYPELRQAEQRLQAGQCPACGAGLSASSDECPDCGLYLGGGAGPDDCGGCGPNCH